MRYLNERVRSRLTGSASREPGGDDQDNGDEEEEKSESNKSAPPASMKVQFLSKARRQELAEQILVDITSSMICVQTRT